MPETLRATAASAEEAERLQNELSPAVSMILEGEEGLSVARMVAYAFRMSSLGAILPDPSLVQPEGDIPFHAGSGRGSCRSLLGWVEPDPARTEVRWGLAGLTLHLHARRGPDGAPLDLLSTQPLQEKRVTLTLPMPGAEPKVLSAGRFVLDETVGDVYVEIPFADPSDASAAAQALWQGTAELSVEVTHRYNVVGAGGDDSPLNLFPHLPELRRPDIHIAEELHLRPRAVVELIRPPHFENIAGLRAVFGRAAMTQPSAAPVEVVQPTERVPAAAARSTVPTRARFAEVRAVPSAVLLRAIDLGEIHLPPIDPPSDPEPEPPEPPAGIVQQTQSVTLRQRLTRTLDADPLVFPALEQHDGWSITEVTANGLSLTATLRAAPDQIGTYYMLPSKFRMGVRLVEGVDHPAVSATLVSSLAPDGTTHQSVRLVVAAVPWVEPALREAIRETMQARRGLPFVQVKVPPQVAGILKVVQIPGLADVELEGGLPVTLNQAAFFAIEVPASRYALVVAALQSEAGLGGQVLFRTPDGEQAIPLHLSLRSLAPPSLSLSATAGLTDYTLDLRNPHNSTLRLSSLRAWWVRRGVVGIFGAASIPLPALPDHLDPGASVSLPLGPPEPKGALLCLGIDVELPSEARIPDWLDALNRDQAALIDQSVVVTLLGFSPTWTAAGLSGWSLRLVDAEGTVVSSGELAPEATEWPVNISRSLADLAAGRAGASGLLLEAWGRWAPPAQGAPQRVPVEGPTVLLRLPGDESTAESYDLIELVGSPPTAAPPLRVGRAMLPLVLDGLRQRRSGWTLRAVAPAPAPVVPDPQPTPVVEPSPAADLPPVLPAPSTPTMEVQVVPTLLDFAATWSMALVTLTATPADGSPVTVTLRIAPDAGNVTSIIPLGIAVPLGTPCEAVVTLIAQDPSRSRVLSLGPVLGPILVLQAPA